MSQEPRLHRDEPDGGPPTKTSADSQVKWQRKTRKTETRQPALDRPCTLWSVGEGAASPVQDTARTARYPDGGASALQ